MGARRAAACLCTARVLREVVAPGGHPSARAGLCGILVSTSGGDLVGTWSAGGESLRWGPRWSDGAALLLRPCVPDYPFRVVRSPSMNASR